MQNQPKKIFLSIDDEIDDFKDQNLENVLWCEDQINSSDLEFVNKKEFLRQIKEKAFDLFLKEEDDEHGCYLFLGRLHTILNEL